MFVVIAALLSNILTVIHLRGNAQRKLRVSERYIFRKLAPCFIAVSNAAAEDWVRAGIPSDHITVVYNPYESVNKASRNKTPTPNCSSYNIKDSESNIIDDDSYRLLFVGQLRSIKGVDSLLRSLINIAISNWTLTIVGDGPERSALEKIVDNNKLLSGRVFFVGWQKEITNYYLENDVLVLPSKKEGFGRSIIEAMIHKLPVVATRVGGIPELINHKITGILVDYGNESALCEALELIYYNSVLRKNIQEEAYKYVCNNFSEEIFIKKLIKICNNSCLHK